MKHLKTRQSSLKKRFFCVDLRNKHVIPMNGRSDRSGMRGSEAGEVRVAELVGKIGMVGILGEVFTPV